ncbi:MAG: hypothetical protein HY879_22760 [Deltaproteobacteria bacterium]|nr:hypothetical protein [Deltaproteobacteria bacterium]
MIENENRNIFVDSIKGSEDTDEFNAFVKILSNGPLSNNLERIIKKEAKRREKKPRGNIDLDKYRNDIATEAAKSFFRNTGTYQVNGIRSDPMPLT